MLHSTQGDQIYRNFAYWVIVYFGPVFQNYKSSQFHWTIFRGESYVCVNLCINQCKKLRWAKFWAIFSKFHLVTLSPPPKIYMLEVPAPQIAENFCKLVVRAEVTNPDRAIFLRSREI
jgi:hypothetical protein